MIKAFFPKLFAFATKHGDTLPGNRVQRARFLAYRPHFYLPPRIALFLLQIPTIVSRTTFLLRLCLLISLLSSVLPTWGLAKQSSHHTSTSPISLNFHNIEVRQALQILAEFAGINLVTSDSVSGTISLRLTHVPWEHALTLILQAKDLEQRRIGSILHITSREEWFKQERQWLEARRYHERQQPLNSATFVLRYRSVEDFRKILDDRTAVADKRGTVLSERGSLFMDPKANILIVTDIPSVLDEIRQLIHHTDIAVRQVQIEAHIVEASDTFSRDLGIKLAFARYQGKVHINNSLENAIHSYHEGKIPALAPSVNLPIAQSLGSIASLFGAGARSIIGLELQAMQAENKGKVISSPRILTADRTEAIIEEGTHIPYQSSTGNATGTTRVEFKPAALSLKVTPHISRDDTIIMNIQLSKDSPNFGQTVQGTPSIDTKKLSTQVLVENGGTVVIGGIHVDEHDHIVNKIPLFSDIPLLGALFRSQRKKHHRRELLVFITPTIITNQRENTHQHEMPFPKNEFHP